MSATRQVFRFLPLSPHNCSVLHWSKYQAKYQAVRKVCGYSVVMEIWAAQSFLKHSFFCCCHNMFSDEKGSFLSLYHKCFKNGIVRNAYISMRHVSLICLLSSFSLC